MEKNLILELLVPLLEKTFFAWQEIWYEVREDESKRYRRIRKDFHACVMWNKEQNIAKLSIYEVDSDNSGTLIFEGASVQTWYMDAIEWARIEIEKQYEIYING